MKNPYAKKPAGSTFSHKTTDGRFIFKPMASPGMGMKTARSDFFWPKIDRRSVYLSTGDFFAGVSLIQTAFVPGHLK